MKSEPSKEAVECARGIWSGLPNTASAVDSVWARRIQQAIDTALAAQQKELEQLRQINKHACEDWAETDTTCKKMAEPFIGNFDDPSSQAYGFRGVEEVTEALCKRLALLSQLVGKIEHDVAGHDECMPDCLACERDRVLGAKQ